ncbi:hypothetical protein Syun_022300 [Stephania yunnanensis]|uniref:Uncharacterized protein n=1 Tax=Stephania yunnanensis TaxID=152371 RepID=A0AAP0I342_9MAGN
MIQREKVLCFILMSLYKEKHKEPNSFCTSCKITQQSFVPAAMYMRNSTIPNTCMINAYMFFTVFYFFMKMMTKEY